MKGTLLNSAVSRLLHPFISVIPHDIIWYLGMRAENTAVCSPGGSHFRDGHYAEDRSSYEIQWASLRTRLQKSLCSEMDVMRENTFVYANNTNPYYCSSAGFLC